jgi:hypothetical protein
VPLANAAATRMDTMTTCSSGGSAYSLLRLAVIADPCRAASTNEAANFWALIGAS